MPLAPGAQLGPYTITAELGHGGMGVVYTAHDPRLQRQVAIKLLPPDLTRDDTAKQRFRQKAKAASALDHPNICTIREINETADGQLSAIMAGHESAEGRKGVLMKRRAVMKSAAMAGAGLLTGALDGAGAAAAPAPRQPTGPPLDDFETFELGDFPLISGEVLRSATLAYKTHGQLAADKDNVIVYPTWYAGRHTSNEAFIGEELALDPSRYFIVVPNQFGNGLSSSPSNTPEPQGRMRFPLVHPYDNVRAQHRLLTDRYGIERIKLVVGFSMSGQQAFHWGALYPEMVERIAPICGSAKTSVHNFVFLEGVKAALTADCAWAGGEYTRPPVTGLRAFSRVYAGWFASQSFFRQGLHRAFGDDLEGIFSMAEGLFGSFDANDLLAMLATWQAADIGAHPRFGGDLSAALAAIQPRAFVMPSRTDLYFPPEDNELEVAQMPNAELRVIPTVWGHLAGGARNPEDTAWMSQQIDELLAS